LGIGDWGLGIGPNPQSPIPNPQSPRNGINIDAKNITTALSKVLLIDFGYKNPANSNDNKSVYKVQFKNSSDVEFFIFEITNIEKMIDKLISEGKMTIVVMQGNDRFNIFLFKTTKEILSNFINHIEKLRIEIRDNIQKVSTQSTSGQSNIQNSSLLNLNSGNIREVNHNPINKKRKLQELYNQQSSNANKSGNLQFKKFKKGPEDNNPVKILKKKINLLDLSEDLAHNLFEYVDHQSLSKVSLLSKECKIMYDKYIEKLRLRDDIPTRSFNNILNRFPNLKKLFLGEGKYLKNENFKHFDVDLKNLNSMDLSEITNLNELSIRKLFSKTKSPKIFDVKINFFLESITSAIIYVQEFFSNINDLSIIAQFNSNNIENILKNLEKYPRVFHPNMFNMICEIIHTKQHLKSLNLYLFNLSNLKIEYMPNTWTKGILFPGNFLLSNLKILSINILVIEKVKDLKFLSSAINLEKLRINEIAQMQSVVNNMVVSSETVGNKLPNQIQNKNQLQNRSSATNHTWTSKTLKRCNFTDMVTIPNNLDPEEQLNNLSLDFENDYVEVFIAIFSKMKFLTTLSLGEFVNSEILKVVSLFCKGIINLSISSGNINDDHLKEILNQCTSLNELDIRGCGDVLGSCFTEIDIFPFNLKKVKLSLVNFNFYNLIQFLKNKGVQAENYLIKNKI
jgi:hypothetical protein